MKRYLFLLLILSLTRFSNAQTTGLKFDHFTVKEGLPDPQIVFMTQDDQGYIWIGTGLGLVRYDGYQLKPYLLDKQNTDVFPLYMLMDKKHNMWISAPFGLYRYNRKDDGFTRYSYPVSTKEKITFFAPLFDDDKNNLWGLSYFGEEGKIRVTRFGMKGGHFALFGKKLNPGDYAFLNTINQGLLAGTDIGLDVFDYKGNTFRHFFSITDTSKQKKPRNIYEAPSEPGIFWMSVFDRTAKHLLIERLDSRTKTVKDFSYQQGSSLTAANDTIADVYEDKRHRLWFASQNGLMLFNRQTQKFTVFTTADTDKKVYQNRFLSITEAKNGSFWITSKNGLLSFDPETHLFRRYIANPNDPAALSENFANSLFFDRSGILWASSTSSGIDKVNPLTSAFNTYPVNVRDGTNFHTGETNNIVVSADGYCLFSNEQGIFKWSPGSKNTTKVYGAGKSDNGIDAISLFKDGKICFGNGNGLQIYDPVTRKLQSYSTNENDTTSISENQVNITIQDHTGTVWIGTQDNGLCSFDPLTRKFKRYPHNVTNEDFVINDNGKLDDGTVVSIHEDKQGTIWVGTNYGGLNRLNRQTGKFTQYHYYKHVHIFEVNHIFEDREDRFWIGTYAHGLLEFDRKTGRYTRNFNEDNGLLCNTVTGITEDNKGFLWVSSFRGLTRIDPKTPTLKTFPVNTILPGKNMLFDYNLVRMNDLMVLPLTTAIATFNPRDLDVNPYPPDVHIENVSYSNPVSKSDSVTTRLTYDLSQLELPYNQNRITFNYVALHFTNPAQNKYAYLLDGSDKHWVQAGAMRSVTYNNLSPGTYTFHVKAANSDGVWNNKGDSFTFIIHAPWWQTWWAWTLYIILFVTVVYAFVAYRSRKLMRDKRVLEHKVHVRTEEVMQQKEEIESQRDNLEKAFGELKTTQTQLIQSEKMASLGELTAGIAHEIQNPLNFVNNFSEVSVELVDEMGEELDKGDIEEAKAIGADLKQNLEKIRHHGKRADSIVKGMLEHSRSASGQKELTDINQLAEEYLRLSYHGLRAKDKNFNAELITNFAPDMPKIKVVPQDIGRVMLNLFNNAFYAVNQKSKSSGVTYKPEILVSTSIENEQLVIKVKDNGTGVPDGIKEKIMQPFFTTKPTGEGTGLGLSLTYDIVVKGHGGSIRVDSAEDEGSEFIVLLPII
jgi:signal transduction histidine kinase/ligand-binding sensor domain-containing protein